MVTNDGEEVRQVHQAPGPWRSRLRRRGRALAGAAAPEVVIPRSTGT
ncbi:MAG: hypothetical protein IPJ56_09310 [Gemmatimonadetes bacterium]|nr:hypothetical protein [Gemmatimonadota bacterium]